MLSDQDQFNIWSFVTLLLAIGIGLIVSASITGFIETKEQWDFYLGVGSGITTGGIIIGFSYFKYNAFKRDA